VLALLLIPLQLRFRALGFVLIMLYLADRREVQLIYFSFVTIATLGFGDISPRLPLAQMLVVLEAVLGQFYVAVVIAWLVSVYAPHRKPSACPGRGYATPCVTPSAFPTRERTPAGGARSSLRPNGSRATAAPGCGRTPSLGSRWPPTPYPSRS